MKLSNLILIFGLAISFFVNLSLCLRFVWTRDSILKRVLTRLTMVLFGCTLAFMFLELGFYFSVYQSDSFAFTLTAQRWFARYWRPINSRGYRDREHALDDLTSKGPIFVVGDSIVAGVGIPEARNRMSDQLQLRFGSSFEVVTIAQGGWDTLDEYSALLQYPGRPRVVVLVYCMNDILQSERRVRDVRDVGVPPPYPVVASLVGRFYSLNFIYWRIYRKAFARDLMRQYQERIARSFNDDAVWRAHTEDLALIIGHVRKLGARLLVVIIPDLTDVSGTKPFCRKLAGFFDEQGVESIDFTDRFARRRPIEMIANAFDAHPNEQVHAEISQLIFEKLQSLGLSSNP